MPGDFDQMVWKIVSSIPEGAVMSYGEVAKAAGYPKRARMVSRAMSRSEKKLPWYRVLRSDYSIAFDKDSDNYKMQKSLLENEGVEFKKNKACSCQSMDNFLDQYLWGET